MRTPGKKASPSKSKPQPKTVQLKTKPAVSNRQPPAAPPVYRPQLTPKVLQRQVSSQPSPTTTATRQPPAAPPAYRPHPTPKVLQRKKAAIQLRPATQTRTGLVNTTPASAGITPVKASTIQLSSDKLVRHAFSYKVQKTLKLKYGEHRRHIIPNHLMKNMLQNWWDCHEDDDEGENTDIDDLQFQLDTMNNYMPNLVPGEGTTNTAIGMLATNIDRRLPQFEEDVSTPKEIAQGLGQFGGFQQARQRELMEPVLKTYKKDPEISTTHEDAFEMAMDIQFSTDFDWPGGKHFDKWHGTYEAFRDIESNPQNYTWAQLKGAIKTFMKLPSPKS